jgi:tetratricopeptide (TPR) repeat protein
METAVFWLLLGLVVLFVALFVISFFKQRGNLKWVTPFLLLTIVLFVFQGNLKNLTLKVLEMEISFETYKATADDAFAGVPMSLSLGEPTQIPEAALQFAETIENDPDLQEYLARDPVNLLKYGNIKYQQGELEKASDTYERALAVAEEQGENRIESAALENLSLVYEDQGDLDKAADFRRRAGTADRNLTERETDAARPLDRERVYPERSVSELTPEQQQEMVASLNKRGQYLRARGETDKAINYLQRSLELSRQIGYREGEANSLSEIGLLHLEKGDRLEAQRYAGQIEAILDSSDLGQSREAVMRSLRQIRREP